ncbi:MAG TPA: amidohydrolase [Stellaceae bacterium]|nr:amidohydrolase [Stellaceae bacterium]
MITADLVLRRGNIMTFDPQRPRTQALAVAGERILALGEEAEALVGPQTNVIDLAGQAVIPGLFDSHIHTVMGGLNEIAVSLEGARSIADVQAAFAARARVTPKGAWIRGSSAWHESQLVEGRLPNRFELDAVTPDHPVIMRRGGHVVVGNSAAFALAGITRATPDPQHGVIVRDSATGEPTGVLVERAAFSLLLKHVPPPSRAEHVAGLTAFTKKLNSRGITSTLEPGLTLEEIAAYMELWRQKAMTTRVRILQRVHCVDDVEALSSVLAPDFGDDRLRIGGFKFSADGGIEAAYMHDPYRVVEGEQTDAKFVGKLVLPPGGLAELKEMFTIAASRGWQFQVHMVGDAAIDAILDLVEGVAEKYPLGKLRWTMVHIFLPSERALARIKRLGLRATVQDQPVKLGHNMVRYWGEERAARSIPIKSIVAAGIPTGGGTDAPVVGWNPFESMWWMTTRQVYTQSATRILGAEEAVDRAVALDLYTRGSAETCFMEDEIGTLEPGKFADLAVLTDDPITVPADRLRDVQSALTLLGGRIVHREGL